jgi:hypothetical protein
LSKVEPTPRVLPPTAPGTDGATGLGVAVPVPVGLREAEPKVGPVRGVPVRGVASTSVFQPLGEVGAVGLLTAPWLLVGLPPNTGLLGSGLLVTGALGREETVGAVLVRGVATGRLVGWDGWGAGV